MVSYIILGVLLAFLIFVFSHFRPAATKKITDNLYTVNSGFVNFYALSTTDGVVLFDIGMNAAFAKRGMKKLGISPDAVTHIFMTHTDFDHIGGLSAFPAAALYISNAEEQMINGQTARRGFMRNKRLKSYNTMKDGEIFTVGNTTIQLHPAPGHTPGSSVYMIDNRILVTGDLLRISKKGMIKPFLRLMNMNHRQDIESVEAQRGLTDEAEYILTGHTGYFYNALKKRR